MREYDIVVLTDDRYIDPKVKNQYIENVMLEDELVIEALEKEGLKTIKKSWSDPQFDWKQTKYILFRSTWDYAERFIEFSDWLIQVSMQTKLINPYTLIVWNLDKHYLNDLKMRRVNVVETQFVEFGDQRTLSELHKELGWTDTVLKPVVSAAAKDTYRLNPQNISEYEARYSELVKNEAMMLQPFQESVLDRGELSLIVIGGQYTHAVLKVAKPGDFRVQDDFGGTAHPYEPTQEEIHLAVKAVKVCNPQPLYARVDMVNDNEGNPAISELELLEPELWFRKNEAAVNKLAVAIKNYAQKSSKRIV